MRVQLPRPAKGPFFSLSSRLVRIRLTFSCGDLLRRLRRPAGSPWLVSSIKKKNHSGNCCYGRRHWKLPRQKGRTTSDEKEEEKDEEDEEEDRGKWLGDQHLPLQRVYVIKHHPRYNIPAHDTATLFTWWRCSCMYNVQFLVIGLAPKLTIFFISLVEARGTREFRSQCLLITKVFYTYARCWKWTSLRTSWSKTKITFVRVYLLSHRFERTIWKSKFNMTS